MADLIDRNALLKWSKEFYPEEKQFQSAIMNAPTVDAVPVRHGRWIGYETSSYNGIDDNGEVKWIPKKFFRCSICRKGTAVRSEFCPNCGAKMDGGNDNG